MDRVRYDSDDIVLEAGRLSFPQNMLQRSLSRKLTSLLSILSVFIPYSIQKATRFPAYHPQGPQGELGDQPAENNNHNDLPPKASKERQYDAVIIGAGWADLRVAPNFGVVHDCQLYNNAINPFQLQKGLCLNSTSLLGEEYIVKYPWSHGRLRGAIIQGSLISW